MQAGIYVCVCVCEQHLQKRTNIFNITGNNFYTKLRAISTDIIMKSLHEERKASNHLPGRILCNTTDAQRETNKLRLSLIQVEQGEVGGGSTFLATICTV
jgi:hypothetical protein